MRAHVGAQVARLGEGAIADGTVERLFGTVNVSRVPHQLLPAFEPLRACTAGVRPIVGVHCADVRLQSSDQLKLAAALVAVVRGLAAAMYPRNVHSQNHSQLKAEAALTTDVRSSVGVSAFVVVARRVLSKAFVTARMSTGKRSFTGVGNKVGHQQLALAKNTSTFSTDMLLDHIFMFLPSGCSTCVSSARGSATTLTGKFNHKRNFCGFILHVTCIW